MSRSNVVPTVISAQLKQTRRSIVHDTVFPALAGASSAGSSTPSLVEPAAIGTPLALALLYEPTQECVVLPVGVFGTSARYVRPPMSVHVPDSVASAARCGRQNVKVRLVAAGAVVMRVEGVMPAPAMPAASYETVVVPLPASYEASAGAVLNTKLSVPGYEDDPTISRKASPEPISAGAAPGVICASPVVPVARSRYVPV